MVSKVEIYVSGASELSHTQIKIAKYPSDPGSELQSPRIEVVDLNELKL
jgi:hypothetical protein